jgi:hypothetical protein
MVLTSSENIVVTGGFTGEDVDFNPDQDSSEFISSLGESDVYILSFNSLGEFLWVKTFGGLATDDGYAIATSSLNEIYTTGNFNQTVNFHTDLGIFELVSQGPDDLFIHKMGFCIADSLIDSVTSCGSFTWIDGIEYLTDNTTASFSMINSQGCDSIVTLNLTIIHLDTSITITNNTLSANSEMDSFQWLDCSNGFALLEGETMMSFTPSDNGSYSVEITKENCIDTSSCYSLIIVGNDSIIRSSKLISIFPNPTNDILNIKGLNPETIIRLYDFSGKCVFNNIFIKDNVMIPVNTFNNGLYTIQFTYKETISNHRVIINR